MRKYKKILCGIGIEAAAVCLSAALLAVEKAPLIEEEKIQNVEETSIFMQTENEADETDNLKDTDEPEVKEEQDTGKAESKGEQDTGETEAKEEQDTDGAETKEEQDTGGAETKEEQDTGEAENSGQKQEKDYIKWVDFNVTSEAMKQAYVFDVESYHTEQHLSWIDLLAVLGVKYGGDFTRYRAADMNDVAETLLSGEVTLEEYTKNMQYFSYYQEAYGAVLGGMVGEYRIEQAAESGGESAGTPENVSGGEEGQTDDSETVSSKKEWKSYYGLKAFNPIAKGFPYSDYDDFGVSRTYGYQRNHLGHDLMGQVGTPVISVESGKVTALGWNQYGGWRIGIESFDGMRYYYYAHLRQNRPYAEGLEVGDIVQAGDVIGYMGRTGYSTEENVNNIDEYHLHFGLQLIFDESQREGNGEIWVSGYELVRFLSQNRSEVQRNDETKEWTRVYQIRDPAVESYLSEHSGEQ